MIQLGLRIIIKQVPRSVRHHLIDNYPKREGSVRLVHPFFNIALSDPQTTKP